jgi:hypothetical protein
MREEIMLVPEDAAGHNIQVVDYQRLDYKKAPDSMIQGFL